MEFPGVRGGMNRGEREEKENDLSRQIALGKETEPGTHKTALRKPAF